VSGWDEAVAADRIARHANDPSRVSLRPQREVDLIGVVGERCFAAMFGLPLAPVVGRRALRHNFLLADGTRVDVVCSPAARWLPIPVERFDAGDCDAWALMRFKGFDGGGGGEAVPVGWCDRATAEQATVGVLVKGGRRNRLVPARWLAPMADLLARHRAAMQPALF